METSKKAEREEVGKEIKMLKRIGSMIYTISFNVLVGFRVKLSPRDEKIIVIGAWMGERFADNSRYLFQYLSENKVQLGLKHIIWITRNQEICNLLKNQGYEVCLAGTAESKSWHLKAGIHIICNNSGLWKYKPDIDTQYSWGAKRIQLWHGVGFKAVGSSANKTQNHQSYRNIINKCRKIKNILSQGGWADAYILATSEFNKKVMKESLNSFDDRVFISAYPRFCECLNITPEEKDVIAEIQNYDFCVIYLPTFREGSQTYIHPLADENIRNYLLNNNILWIEKQHLVSEFSVKEYEMVKNVMILSQKFDVNVIYDYIDVIISDYSSVVCDGFYKNISTIMYTPDLSEFQNGANGLLIDVNDYFGAILADNIEEIMIFIEKIRNKKFWTLETKKLYEKAQKDFFESEVADYYKIWMKLQQL